MKLVARALSFVMGLTTLAASGAELKVGDMAPDFTLPASDGKTYSLSDYRNKRTVVLAWYPKAFTSGCTIECKSLARNGHLLKGYQVAYFMASTDRVDTNTSFAKETRADFPLLSDPSKATARAYGVLNAFGMANRHTFYIGPDGRILAIDRRVDPETSAEDMAARLEKLGTPKLH